MCECLCNQISGDVVFHLKRSSATIAVDAYRGCPNCEKVIGIDVRVFDRKGCDQLLGGNRGIEIVPDEYGVLPTAASYELFHIDDLVVAFEETGFPPPDGYDEWSEFVADHGLTVVQSAMRAADKRRRKENGLCGGQSMTLWNLCIERVPPVGQVVWVLHLFAGKLYVCKAQRSPQGVWESNRGHLEIMPWVWTDTQPNGFEELT